MADDSDEADSWEDYSSEQMFEGCDCGHPATGHKAAWGDWRDFEGCEHCACEVEWCHT